MKKILIVDDEEEALEVLADYLTDMGGYAVQTAAHGQAALDLLAQSRFDLVLLDLHMPKVSGEEVIMHLHVHAPETAIIVMTGYVDAGRNRVQMRYLNVDGYFEKPLDLAELLKASDQILSTTCMRFVS